MGVDKQASRRGVAKNRVPTRKKQRGGERKKSHHLVKSVAPSKAALTLGLQKRGKGGGKEGRGAESARGLRSCEGNQAGNLQNQNEKKMP